MIAALNKYYRPMSLEDYKDTMDLIDVQNAVEIAGIPKAVADRIWQKERQAFEVY